MEKTIKLHSHQEAQAVCGAHDEYLRAIEKELKVKLAIRGELLKVGGTGVNIKKASGLIGYILEGMRSGQTGLGRSDLYSLISNFEKEKGPIKIKGAVEWV